MADNTTTNDKASVEVPRQDQTTPVNAEAATAQFKATGGADAEVAAKAMTAEDIRQKALKDEAAAGRIHGVPKDEFQKLTLGEQKRAELNNPYSDLRNRLTQQDEVDYQILSSTNAYTIEAMTGVPISKLTERAKELGVNLKDSAAGNGGPGTGVG
jgi:hypothetical protein